MSRNRIATGVFLIFALLLSSCGSGSDDAGRETSTEDATNANGDGREEAEPEPEGGEDGSGEGVEGCGTDSATDADDLDPQRTIARCEPGSPAPKPLEERRSVNIASAAQAETSAWLYMAKGMGEFDAENLDVEIHDMSFADAMPQILNGQIQAAIGGAEAGWYNGVGAGMPITWVLGNFFPPDAHDPEIAQTGLWVNRQSFQDPDDPDLTELSDLVLGSAVGPASTIMYPISEALDEFGVDLADMETRQLPAPDVVTALTNGAVDAAWLLDPTWTVVEDDPDFLLAATQTPVEPIGGLYMGEQMLTTDREVGLAIVRAIVRTINTHLEGDYRSDSELAQHIADALDVPLEVVAHEGSSLVFDWEIRAGTTDRTQQVFQRLGVLEQDLIPEGDLVDRSLYLEAVGRCGDVPGC